MEPEPNGTKRGSTDFSSFKPMTPASESELAPDIEHTSWIGYGCLFLVFGKRLYGVVDAVPECFYVATSFYHLFWFPLIPAESWILHEYSESADAYYGVPTTMNWKSIIVAYSRAFLIGLSIICLIAAASSLRRPSEALAFAAIVVLCFLCMKAIQRYQLASPERAAELAAVLGWEDEEINLLTQRLESGQEGA